MGKHLVDIDEKSLRTARRRLGTKTIKDTVNQALRKASDNHQENIERQLDVLSAAELAPREQAWR